MSATEMYAPPSQAWLDENGVELTGEFRVPKNDDELIYSPKKDFQDKIYSLRTILLGTDICGGKRWILRKKPAGPVFPKPSQAWLDKYDVELTGELRTPINGDLVVPNGIHHREGQPMYVWDHGPTPTAMQKDPAYQRLILRKRNTLKCPPRPTDERVAEMCRNQGIKKMRLTGVCEDPKGRPFVTYTNLNIYTLDVPGENHPEYGYRRWVLEEVPEAQPEKLPWRLNKIHDGKLVESKDGTKWGTIAGSDGHRFILMDGRTIYPDDLLRDWTWNGQPCSF